MKGSTVSRRFSEFVGVALFAAALIWIIALATYSPTDPVWFFSAVGHGAPGNFAGRIGAFMAELAYQILGYSAYLIPVVLIVAGWHYFWCKSLDARYTKATGAASAYATSAGDVTRVVVPHAASSAAAVKARAYFDIGSSWVVRVLPPGAIGRVRIAAANDDGLLAEAV